MLTIQHTRHWYEPRLPHLVFLDGHYAGALQDDELHLAAPAGLYQLRVQFGGRISIGKSGHSIDLSLSSTLQLEARRDTIVTFHDRERLWNVLFDIDLVLWVASLFLAMPPLYKVLSDTFFVVWLVRLVLIRKRYYKVSVVQA